MPGSGYQFVVLDGDVVRTGIQKKALNLITNRLPVLSADQTRSSFTDIYRQHHGQVHALASRLVGSTAAADITQEVFVSLWRDPTRFDATRGSMRSFLMALAHHRSVDMIRVNSARQRREELGAHEEPVEDDGSTAMLRELDAARVKAALAAIDETQREAIEIAFYGDCSYRDTALVLGVPEGTAKSRIRFGLIRLRKVLEDKETNRVPGAGESHRQR